MIHWTVRLRSGPATPSQTSESESESPSSSWRLRAHLLQTVCRSQMIRIRNSQREHGRPKWINAETGTCSNVPHNMIYDTRPNLHFLSFDGYM